MTDENETEEEEETPQKLNKSGLPRKKVVRKGIEWKKKYKLLEERYDQLQGKLDEEVADIETEDEDDEDKSEKETENSKCNNKCPFCKSFVEDYTTFCPACGKKLEWGEE